MANDYKCFKVATSVRLTPEALRLWAALAKKLGLTKSACLELAIRKMAELSKIE